jgi:hypothetical protein
LIGNRNVRQFPGAFAGAFRFQVPQRTIHRISRRAGWEQLLQFIAIQIIDDLDRFDLRKNGIGALIVARDRHRFAASGVLSITHTDCCDARFGAAAARNPERVIQRKNFFLGFDFQSGE